MHRSPQIAAFFLFATALPISRATADKGAVPRNEPVHPMFGLTNPSDGPFPADRFMVADPAQNTCERVNLPKPICPSFAQWKPGDSWECVELDLMNELDGFSLNPRVAVPFSGPIDPSTADGNTMFFVRLGSSLVGGIPECIAPDREDEEDDDDGTDTIPESGLVVGINQRVWDPATNTLYATADELLDEHARYALIVTTRVRDASGNPIAPSAEFEQFLSGGGGGQERTLDPVARSYRHSLRRALARAHLAGAQPKDVAVASVFTTMSVTSPLQKIRDQIVSAPAPARIDFHLLGTGQPAALFDLAKITKLTLNAQTRTTGALAQMDLATRLASVKIIPGVVSRIAFGRYETPNYLRADYTMPSIATYSGSPIVDHLETVVVGVFLPTATAEHPKPAAGWPVVLFAHGSGDTVLGGPFNIAAQMAAHGLATVSINLEGNGFGAASTLTVTRAAADGGAVTIPTPGRSSDSNGDGLIGVSEGPQALAPRTILQGRHSLRQRTADFLQLVREIQAGVDVDGDGAVDLDAGRIYFFGWSAGASVAVQTFAVEPAIRAGVFAGIGGGGPWQSPPSRGAVGQFLTVRVPPLINSPGVGIFHGITVGTPWFDEDIPERDAAPLVKPVEGAIAIQGEFDRVQWLGSGSFAPYLRLKPLPGVPQRPFLILEARGDQMVTNPGTARFVRAGDLDDRVMLYRHDLFASNKSFPDPHGVIMRTDSVAPAMQPLALADQNQVATFFEKDGDESNGAVIDPDGDGPLFEAPARSIPQDYGFCATSASSPNCVITP